MSNIWWIPVTAFLVIKFGGTGLAAWSAWWVLLPIVPLLALALQKAGVL